MAVKGFFFNAVKSGGTYDRTYNAENFTDYLRQIVGNGVFPIPANQLLVSAGTGMQVIVASGNGWINGFKITNTADLPLTIDGSDILLDRIDRVIFYVDMTERAMGIEVLKGTPASSPVAPSLTQTDTRYELCLATVEVDHGTTTINAGMITDTRLDSSVCGYVAGLIQQLDTTGLYQQFTYQFNHWFDMLTENLLIETYIQKYSKRVVLSASQSNVIPLDMGGYTYYERDVIEVYINGLFASDGYDYLIDYSATPPEVHVNASANGTVIEIVVLKSKIGYNQIDNAEEEVY